MQTSVTCITNGKVMLADILEHSAKRIKVVFVGGNQTLVLSRTDSNTNYLGRFAGLEFQTNGKEK